MSRNPSRATARRAPVGAGASHPSARPLRPALAALVAALLSVGVGIGLVGCVPGPDASPSPTATAAGPRFASDEEALAAAEEAYAAYRSLADQISNDGGLRPERIATVTTPELAAQEIAGYQELSAAGLRTVGLSQFSSLRLDDRRPRTDESVSVVLCDDVSGIEVVGPDGKVVTSPTRPDAVWMAVSFAWSSSDNLVVAAREVLEDGSC